jgi:hypothetical protein
MATGSKSRSMRGTLYTTLSPRYVSGINEVNIMERNKKREPKAPGLEEKERTTREGKVEINRLGTTV